MSISEQLRNYPFPDPLLTLTYYQLTVVGLEEGRCAVAKIPTVHQILNRKALQSVPFLTPLVNIWSIRASFVFQKKEFYFSSGFSSMPPSQLKKLEISRIKPCTNRLQAYDELNC